MLAGAVEELDHAVMLELHAFSEDADGRFLAKWETENCYEKLIVLDLESARPALAFTEVKEAPDLIPKFSEREELLTGQIARGHRKYIIS
jgi:hypothetical protein